MQKGLSRVVPQLHLCGCMLRLQWVLSSDHKFFTRVASQWCCLMACVHLLEKPGGGVGMCHVVWLLVSASLWAGGMCQLSCFGRSPLPPCCWGGVVLLPKASWPCYHLHSVAFVTLPSCWCRVSPCQH